MKTYQVVEYGKPIIPQRVPDPVPTAKEVVVDVVACGLCHSDAHFQEGYLGLGGDQKLPLAALGVTLPATFGHEIVGRISAYGPLMSLSIAKGTGFGRIAAVDIDDGKLALARDGFGADVLINSRSEDAAARLKEETAEAGLMAVVDLVASEQTACLALEVLANGGT